MSHLMPQFLASVQICQHGCKRLRSSEVPRNDHCTPNSGFVEQGCWLLGPSVVFASWGVGSAYENPDLVGVHDHGWVLATVHYDYPTAQW